MVYSLLLVIVYFYLLKKFNKVLKNYESFLQNTTNDDYFLDYCDEPICFR